MHSDVARELKLPIHPDSVTASGVNQNQISIIGRTATILRLGSYDYKHCFHVAEDITHEILLGTDFLSKLGDVTYNFTKGEFGARGEVIPMGECETKFAVRTVCQVSIPPFSEVAVIAQIDTANSKLQPKSYCFEGVHNSTPRHIMVGRSVSHTGKTGAESKRFPVPIMNTSGDILTLQVNTMIGEAEEVDEDDIQMTNISLEQKPRQTRPGDSLDQSDTALDDHQMHILRDLINEYSDIIGEDITELGQTDIVQHVIETKPGVAPIRSKPYNIPVGLRAEVKRQLDVMLDKGLIQMSSGTWTSPIVLVKKKDGSYRFCVDYRKLNSVTEKQAMCLSNIENTMEIMHGKKFFSAIDLCSGFWQVKLHEDSQEKSGFITPWGTFSFTRMPMGTSSSPATFNRLSLAIMADLISQGSSVVYLDDWLLTSKDFDSHITLLRTVFDRLRYVGLKYRLSKSQFFQTKITYLGHVISEDGITVAPHNVEKIKNFPPPKNQTEVRRLLGLFGFYRSFVKAYSQIVSPMTKLLSSDLPRFHWGPDSQAAMEKLQSIITSAPVLIFPDFSALFILTTDASGIAIGAVLSQEREKKLHPIAFYSKTLNKTQQRWEPCEQELYAIVCSVKRFRGYLMNCQFHIQTDNMGCLYLLKTANLSGRLARWAVQLSDYDFTISHTPGKSNVVADALSRAQFVNMITSDERESTEEEREMSVYQSKDFYLGPIMLFKTKGKVPHDATKRNARLIKKESEDFELIHGVLYREINGLRRLAVPVSQRNRLIWANHDSLMALHPGVTKTLLKLQARYWWPHMARDVTTYITQCDSCQRKKNPKIPMRVPLKNQMATYPFEVLSVDFQGPFTQSTRGNKNVLVWVDHFTKWIEMEATKDQLATTVAASYIDRIFCRYGASRILISDRAKNFLSEVVHEINKLLKVDHRLTTPYHPQTNGQVEVYNRSIGQMLAHVTNESHTDWDDMLPFCMLAHNSSRHTIINASPSLLLMCREPRLPYDLTIPAIEEPAAPGTYAAELHNKMSMVWSAAREAIGHSKRLQKKYYDRNTRPSTIKVGDAVLYYNQRGYRNKTSKLIKRWQGIYIVKDVDETNAKIQLFNNPDGPIKKVHLNTLKLYLGPLVRGPESEELDIDFDSPQPSDGDQQRRSQPEDVSPQDILDEEESGVDLYDRDTELDAQDVPDVASNANLQTDNMRMSTQDDIPRTGSERDRRVSGSEQVPVRRCGARQRRKKRDPQFVYSDPESI